MEFFLNVGVHFAKIVSIVTAFSLIIGLLMGEFKHPYFSRKVYWLEYRQSLINLFTSTLVKELIKLINPGLFLEAQEDNIFQMLLTGTIYLLLFDTFSYWCHRLMHTRIFYKRFHLLHHQYKPVLTINALSTSIVDTLILGQIPVWASIYLLSLMGGISETILNIDLTFIMIWSLYAHSLIEHKINGGFLIDNFQHIKHHRLNSCNYSTLFRFWDHFCQTLV